MAVLIESKPCIIMENSEKIVTDEWKPLELGRSAKKWLRKKVRWGLTLFKSLLYLLHDENSIDSQIRARLPQGNPR
jgi:hypothetical protein